MWQPLYIAIDDMWLCGGFFIWLQIIWCQTIMFNPFEASNSVKDQESFIVECFICLFCSVIPIFLNLWGQGSWLTVYREIQNSRYKPTFVTDNYQEVKKLWVWEIGLLYYLICHVTSASFKQGVENYLADAKNWQST